jgi:SAM-dependent methyltransferase
MTRPHSPEWYDRLSTLQDGYYYPWKSQLTPGNGEDAYLALVGAYLSPSTDLLDVGCGHGEVALKMASLCHSVFAYDRVDSYIQIAQESARKQGIENISFLCHDSSQHANDGSVKIPAEPVSFDLLISRRGPLHWIEDARRVARPGAVLIQLNPLETPQPLWAERLPEPLRSATGIEYTHGMLNSVKHRLKLGSLDLHSAWTFDVPEFFDEPRQLYNRLAWGFIPREIPAWEEIQETIEQIFVEYAWPQGVALRHTRLLWMAVVEK